LHRRSFSDDSEFDIVILQETLANQSRTVAK